MSTPAKVALVVAAPVLATLAAFWLAQGGASADGGMDGWEDLVALVTAAFALFVALVATALAPIVLRSRAWRLTFVIVTAVGLAVPLATTALAGEEWRGRLGELAFAFAMALALWLPVGARWLTSRDQTAPDQTTPDDGDAAPPAADSAPLPRRAVALAAVACGAVIAIVALLLAQLPEGSIPSGVVGFAGVLIVVAAVASGRTPDWTALVLLAAVAVVVVIFDLPGREGGQLAAAGTALAVLITFSWRPLAVRFSQVSARPRA